LFLNIIWQNDQHFIMIWDIRGSSTRYLNNQIQYGESNNSLAWDFVSFVVIYNTQLLKNVCIWKLAHGKVDPTMKLPISSLLHDMNISMLVCLCLLTCINIIIHYSWRPKTINIILLLKVEMIHSNNYEQTPFCILCIKCDFSLIAEVPE